MPIFYDMWRFLLSVIFVVMATSVAAIDGDVQLPEGTKRCKIDSEDRDTCLKDALQDMIPKLYGGLSNLDIPPMEPLVLNRTHFEYNRGPMRGALNMKTATIHGLTHTQVRGVNSTIDDAGMQIGIEVYYPRLQIDGVYRAEGEFNGARMNARGIFNVTFKHVSTMVSMHGEFVEKEGERYLHVNAFNADVSMDNMKVIATGIFPEPELNKLALDFINQNWPSIYRTMIPDTKDIWEPRMIEEMNAFLMRVPIRVLLY